MNIFKHLKEKLLQPDKKELDALKNKVVTGREKDIQQLQTINKHLKLATKNGSIELIITNIQGIIEEIEK
jgi:hypothetical protein